MCFRSCWNPPSKIVLSHYTSHEDVHVFTNTYGSYILYTSHRKCVVGMMCERKLLIYPMRADQKKWWIHNVTQSLQNALFRCKQDAVHASTWFRSWPYYFSEHLFLQCVWFGMPKFCTFLDISRTWTVTKWGRNSYHRIIRTKPVRFSCIVLSFSQLVTRTYHIYLSYIDYNTTE